MFLSFINYFKITWIGSFNIKMNRWSPLFLVNIWNNCFERLQNCFLRINYQLKVDIMFFDLTNKILIWKFISTRKKNKFITKITKKCIVLGYILLKTRYKKKKKSKRIQQINKYEMLQTIFHPTICLKILLIIWTFINNCFTYFYTLFIL